MALSASIINTAASLVEIGEVLKNEDWVTTYVRLGNQTPVSAVFCLTEAIFLQRNCFTRHRKPTQSPELVRWNVMLALYLASHPDYLPPRFRVSI
jgi:hypothetical protein